MLSGELIGLRTRVTEDVEILHAELYDDVAIRVRTDTRPWVPLPPGPASPFWVPGLGVDPPDAHAGHAGVAVFSVVELATGELGSASTWCGCSAATGSGCADCTGCSLRPLATTTR